MGKRRFAQVLVMAAAAALSSLVQRPISRYQATSHLERVADSPDVSATLALATFALGPLRGLIVDALWWRAMQQQADGEYFDALLLADWITQLQPTFSSVWAFHGWNMAYNIASDFPGKEDRWLWITRGMTLLRDRGLGHNPGNATIRHELGRIFHDRVGGKTDPAGEYYKNQWAFTMMRYLEQGNREELAWLSAAARTPAELRARAGVAEYVDLAMREVGMDVADPRRHSPGPGGVPVKMDEGGRRRAAEEVYRYHRRLRIERDLKMDPERMLFIDREYGPLDWRLHQAHAIYWVAEDRFEDFITQSVNYSLLVRQAMASAFHEGKLFYDPERNIITRTANLEIIGKLHDYIEYLLEHNYSPNVARAHVQFAHRATVILYSYNRDTEAREMFRHLTEYHMQDEQIDYETFILRSLRTTLEAPGEQGQRGLILAGLHQAVTWLDIGEVDRSNGYLNLAQLMWRRHQARYQNEPAKLLPPFEQLVKAARHTFAQQRGLSDEDLAARAAAARAAPASPVPLGHYRDREARIKARHDLEQVDPTFLGGRDDR